MVRGSPQATSGGRRGARSRPPGRRVHGAAQTDLGVAYVQRQIEETRRRY
ncbi:hypothetical protein [Nocardiopsis lambiniae]|uniref:Uncharacterized protein n=1 Tax=Nocardiopsis lambiniae TaxID=3075539 RepID=A0ABU2M368_9ACTN|nr:hypothetical protein [Nocardiopsis sp. DSM 44743]MDT0327067.1 hypothetical protein [Nocardiopsis sp. DSM 44743]